MRRAAAVRGGLVILAPAKINVGLAVLGKRDDGYHELRTVFQSVSLCDRLRLVRARRGVRVLCPALPDLGEENLAHRAAALFFARSGAPGGVVIELEKRIPAGGGLGGGSSDAAAVLVGCCRLFGIRPALATLLDWAAELGSDVPFFIGCGTALGSGRGEQLETLPPFPGPVAALIYLPPAGLATVAVYRRLDAAALTAGQRRLTILLACWRAGDLQRLGRSLFNDLEEPALALAPGLAAVKHDLVAAGAAGALLCGSGSSIFGLFESPGAAREARKRLLGRVPGRLVTVRFQPARRRWGVVKR